MKIHGKVCQTQIQWILVCVDKYLTLPKEVEYPYTCRHKIEKKQCKIGSYYGANVCTNLFMLDVSVVNHV